MVLSNTTGPMLQVMAGMLTRKESVPTAVTTTSKTVGVSVPDPNPKVVTRHVSALLGPGLAESEHAHTTASAALQTPIFMRPES